MTENKCAVSWCTSLALPVRLVCKLHADRPVLHSLERHESYMARLREEDAAQRKMTRRARVAAAPKTARVF